MKVQWKLVDVDSGKAVSIGAVFELIDFMKPDFDNQAHIEWDEALLLYGDPTSLKNPIGIINI
jgi:hypothetical protein